jgi:hypothetical protein
LHNGHSDFIFKLDYEKTYDRADRDFLLKMMEKRGFNPYWMSIIKGLSYNGYVGVRLNDKNSEFFFYQ